MKLAIGCPTAAWIPDRRVLMEALRPELSGADYYREFKDPEPWMDWFTKMLRWATSTDADWFLTLQDDVELAPNFFPALHAMMTAWPGEVIGLAATHSLAREVARQGRRSYRTPKVVGWGWAMPMPMVTGLLEWAEAGNLKEFHAKHPTDGEDTFTAAYLLTLGIKTRSPVPTIIDHRHVSSTNEGFDDHTHRRSVVTWRGYEALDMAVPSWWQTACTDLPHDDWRKCWACGERPDEIGIYGTKARICRVCLTAYVASQCGLQMRVG